jgi:predicted protein tyrosine phosphatase
VVVHCRAGLSRSPAIAIAIAELNRAPVAHLEKAHPLWNRHVRTTVVATAQEDVRRGRRAPRRVEGRRRKSSRR